MYRNYVCDVPELGDILEEINNSKEKIVGCFYVSDSQQAVIIVEGAPDFFKAKIKNLINPSERDFA